MDNEILLFLIFGFITGWFIVKYMNTKAAINAELRQIIAKHVHEIKVEQHGDQMYWFDKETDTFYAQGKTVNECIDVIKQRFSNDVFIYDVANIQYLLAAPDFEPIRITDVQPEGATK